MTHRQFIDNPNNICSAQFLAMLKQAENYNGSFQAPLDEKSGELDAKMNKTRLRNRVWQYR